MLRELGRRRGEAVVVDDHRDDCERGWLWAGEHKGNDSTDHDQGDQARDQEDPPRDAALRLRLWNFYWWGRNIGDVELDHRPVIELLLGYAAAKEHAQLETICRGRGVHSGVDRDTQLLARPGVVVPRCVVDREPLGLRS